jgi:hypothetical protein
MAGIAEGADKSAADVAFEARPDEEVFGVYPGHGKEENP